MIIIFKSRAVFVEVGGVRADISPSMVLVFHLCGPYHLFLRFPPMLISSPYCYLSEPGKHPGPAPGIGDRQPPRAPNLRGTQLMKK